MKKIYLQINIVANNEVRNIAFAKGINRSINLGNVEKILAMMKVKGYRKAEQIQVIKAEDVIKTGDISLVILMARYKAGRCCQIFPCIGRSA